MEKLRMPASYATLPEEELPEIFGGGELGDALDSFTDNLTWMIFSSGGDPLHLHLICASAPVQCCCFRLPVCREHFTRTCPTGSVITMIPSLPFQFHG